MDSQIRTKEVDISTNNHPNLAKIGDYQPAEKTTKIVNLLKQYEDFFSRDYKYLKGRVHEMGEMKIQLLLDENPIKKRPYKLTHKYKDIVKKEINNMLKASIIYLDDQSKWAIPMVVQPKKHDLNKLKVSVDF